LTATAVDESLIKKAVKTVLIGEKSKNENVSLVLAGPAKMKALNHKYRKKNMTTDVLTFSGLDILICPKVIKGNAKRYGVSFKRELAQIVIHGTLHWLGYDHELGEKEAEKMQSKEKRYFKKVT